MTEYLFFDALLYSNYIKSLNPNIIVFFCPLCYFPSQSTDPTVMVSPGLHPRNLLLQFSLLNLTSPNATFSVVLDTAAGGGGGTPFCIYDLECGTDIGELVIGFVVYTWPSRF